MKTQNARVYTQRQRSKWPIYFAAALLIALTLGTGLWWSGKRKSPTAKPMDTPPIAQTDVTPPVSPKVPDVPKPQAKPAGEAAVAPPEEPQKRKTPCTVVLKRVETVRGDGTRITAKLHCQFTDQSKDARIYGIGDNARVVLLDTGARKVPGEPWGYGGPCPLTNYGAEFTVTTQLEDNEGKIVQLDGVMAIVRPGPREMVEFTDFSPQAIGTSLKLKGFTFTLAECKVEHGVANIDTIIQFPPVDPLRPNVASEFFWYLKYQLLSENGAITTPSGGGGGGGMADGRHHYVNRFTLGAPQTKSFQISFVPRVEVEEVDFTLNNIEIPRRDIAASPAAPMKRGARSVKSEEYTFNLAQVELKDGNQPSMDIAVRVHPPEGTRVVAYQHEMGGTTALDDLGSLMKTMYKPWMMQPFGGIQPRANFRYPDDEAKMMKSFKGKFDGYVTDEEISQEFDLTEPEKLKLPAKKGAVTLESFRLVAGTAAVEFLVDTKGLIAEKFNFCGIRQALIDSTGKEIGRPTQGGGSGEHQIKIKAQYVLNDAKPAKIIVWHVTKGHFVSIPFEFNDIEIPRGSKKIEFAQPTQDF